MAEGNKTLHINYRYLTKNDLGALHRTFLEAYKDYFIPIKLSEKQLEHHIVQNSVELEKCVGAFFENRMVAVTLNGFGVWNDRRTVYDAGTGVIPAFRNQGIGKALFDFMLPRFQAEGYERMLLEVISQNEKAIRLYEKLGFRPTRRLIFFEQTTPLELQTENEFEIREIHAPDWDLFARFADGTPSWQNSAEAVERTLPKKLVLGAFLGEECVGYGIVSRNLGMISQLAVAPNARRRRAASTLLGEIRKRIDEDKKLCAANVDENIASAVEFFQHHGFIETFSQLEMIKVL